MDRYGIQVFRGFCPTGDDLHRDTGREGKNVKNRHFRQLGATASCVMQALDAGKNFSSFYNSEFFYSSKEENGDKSLSDESSDLDSTVTDDSQIKMPALKDPPREAPKVTPEK